MSLEGRKREVRYYIRDFFKKIVIKFYEIIYRQKNRKFRDQIFLVYSMRKVGSTSVFRSLFRNIPGIKIFHLHDLSDGFFKEMGKEDPFNSRIKKANEVLKTIKQNPNKKIKIISIVRDPLAVEVSDIFHTLKYSRNARKNTDLSVKGLIKELEKKDYSYAVNWFDLEFKEFLKTDIFEFEFDKNLGYSIIKQDKFDILLVKLEKMENCIENAMKEFIGLDDFELTHFNKTSNEKLGKLYSDLKSSYSIPIHKINEVYNTKFSKYFYTEQEIDGFVKRWE